MSPTGDPIPPSPGDRPCRPSACRSAAARLAGRRVEEGIQPYRSLVFVLSASTAPIGASASFLPMGLGSQRNLPTRLMRCLTHPIHSRARHADAAGTALRFLVLDVFCHPPQLCFRCVDIAGRVDRDAFPHGAVGRSRRRVGRNEDRHLPVFEASDPDSSLPAGVDLLRGLRVGRIQDVVLVESQPAGAAEVVVFADELPSFVRI